jgi:hypothetical protein
MSLFEIYDYAGHLSTAATIGIAVTCLLKFTSRDISIKLIGYYSLTSLMFTLLQRIAINFFNNASINEIGSGFVFCEAVILSIVYYKIAFEKRHKIWVASFAGVYIIMFVVILIFFIENYFSLIRSSRDVLMIINALLFFYALMKDPLERNLMTYPMFWINSAVLFFFSGTFILSFFRDYIVLVLKDDITGYWAFRNFFRFAFCLVLAYAGWLDLRLLRTKTGNT